MQIFLISLIYLIVFIRKNGNLRPIFLNKKGFHVDALHFFGDGGLGNGRFHLHCQVALVRNCSEIWFVHLPILAYSVIHKK